MWNYVRREVNLGLVVLPGGLAVVLNSYCRPRSAEVSWGSFRVSLKDGAKAGSLNEGHVTTWSRAERAIQKRTTKTKKKENRESNPPGGQVNLAWECDEETFTLGLWAMSVRVNTHRVNVCLRKVLAQNSQNLSRHKVTFPKSHQSFVVRFVSSPCAF